MNVRYLIVALVVVAFLSGVGCSQTKEVGRSSKQLFRGETGAVFEHSPEQVGQAVDSAIADLKLMKIGATTRPSKEQTETVVIARNAADKKVTIAFRATTRPTTHTRVAVTTGAFGNSSLRDEVWDAVRVRLGVLKLAGTTPTSPAPATPAPTAGADAAPMAEAPTPATQPTETSSAAE